MKRNEITYASQREKVLEKLLCGDADVGLGDTFQFGCTQCGKCCRNRHSGDIILSPRDIYSMSKELNMNPVDFAQTYCFYIIGANTRMPLMLFKTIGSDKHCPMLINNRCSVEAGKPSACALYPLGRYIDNEAPETVRYVTQSLQCGEKNKTYTVQQWIEASGMDTDEENYIEWAKAVNELSPLLQNLEKTEAPLTTRAIQELVLGVLYTAYDSQEPFLPKFKEIVEELVYMLSNVSELKDVFRRRGVELPEIDTPQQSTQELNTSFFGFKRVG